MFVCFSGVAKLLLEYGAGINTHSNEFKESALTLACYKGTYMYNQCMCVYCIQVFTIVVKILLNLC